MTGKRTETPTLGPVNLQHLRAFVKVVDEGSFGRAALELGVSQAAVSKAVQALERELGVRLLERGRHGARPTAVGTRVLAKARVMLQLKAGLEQEAALERDRAHGGVRGELTLAVFESFSKRILPGLLARLRELHPDLHVRLVPVPETLEGYTRALTDGTVQVAFGAWHVPQACIGWVLMTDRHLVLLPPGTRTTADELDYPDVADMPLVMVADSECSARLRAHLESEGRNVGSTLVAHGNEAVMEMVAQGLGAAILPELAAQPLPDQVRTVPLRGLVRPINVVLPPHGLKVPAVRALLGVVKERFPTSELPVLPL